MRRIRRTMALIVALLLIGFPLSAGQEISERALSWGEAAPTDGALLYQGLCAVCHGTEGRGDGPAAAALKALPPDLTILAAKNDGEFPAKKIAQTIREGGASAHGSREMPIWGHAFTDVRPDRKVSERETRALVRIENLTRYLESIQAKN